MKQSTQRVIATLTLLCYLVASSVAAAHAFPMATSGERVLGDGVTPNNQSLIPLSSLLSFSNQSASTNSTKVDDLKMDRSSMNCHSPDLPMADQAEATKCKIFCSAMAQAVTISWLIFASQSRPTTSLVSLKSEVQSRQLSVEPYPPK